MGRPDKPVDRTVPARANGQKHERRAATIEGHPQTSRIRHLRPLLGDRRRLHRDDRHKGRNAHRQHPRRSSPRPRPMGQARGRATRAPYYLHKAPDPHLIASESDFSRSLRHQHVWAGYPTPGEMQQSANYPWHLPASTTRRIIAGEVLPVGPQQAVAFLRACYLVTPADLGPWLAAATRAISSSHSPKQDVRPWVEAHRDLLALRQVTHEESDPVSVFLTSDGRKLAA